MCGIFLIPILAGLYYYDVAHSELLDTSSSFSRTLTSADQAGILVNIIFDNTKRKIDEVVEGNTCNSTRIEPLLQNLVNVEVNTEAVLTLSHELSVYVDLMYGYLDSAYFGTYRQVFMLLLFCGHYLSFGSCTSIPTKLREDIVLWAYLSMA